MSGWKRLLIKSFPRRENSLRIMLELRLQISILTQILFKLEVTAQRFTTPLKCQWRENRPVRITRSRADKAKPFSGPIDRTQTLALLHIATEKSHGHSDAAGEEEDRRPERDKTKKKPRDGRQHQKGRAPPILIGRHAHEEHDAFFPPFSSQINSFLAAFLSFRSRVSR